MSRFSFLNAPVLPGNARFPVVVDSHGFGSLRMCSEEKAENLASHGYVVVATDHYDAVEVTFPDGSFHEPGATAQLSDAEGVRDRVQDLRFVLDQVEAWNRDDPVLVGRLDLGRVAAMGYSFGGVTAAEACRLDSRFQAAILFDSGPAYTAEVLAQGLRIPSITINRGDNSDLGVFPKAVAGSVWLQISSTVHESFNDAGFFLANLSITDLQEVTRTYNAYLLRFLNQHLRGESVTFPLAGFPRATNVKVK